MIWTDPQYLPWTADERADLAASDDTRWLLNELPGGVHLRPEGGGDSNLVLMLWAYHVEPREPIVPPPLDEFFPEVVLRGMSTMIPGLRAYFGKVVGVVVRWRLLHQDAGESAVGRAAAGGRRVCVRSGVGLWLDGVGGGG